MMITDRPRARLWLTVLLGCIAAPCAVAQEERSAQSDRLSVPIRYSWHEYQIPMRDGVRLYTAVLAPDDDKEYPILMERTPYGAAPSRHQPTADFARSGFIFAFQDVRGRYQSGGVFTQNTPQRALHRGPKDVDESTDTFDTIEWLVKNVPRNNHRVGLRGISYPGFYAAMGMIGAHPALKAVSPQAAEADWFVGDDVHHHGAFLLDSSFFWMTHCMHDSPTVSAVCSDGGFEFGTADDYEFFRRFEPLARIDATLLHGSIPAWSELMQHGTYDEYWSARNELRYIRDIRPAVLMVGGWYDANDFYGTLHIYQTLQASSPATSSRIVVGPWYHGRWGSDDPAATDDPSFGAATVQFFRRSIELPFFEHYLKDAKEANLPKAYMFETGANQWRQFDSWPPRGIVKQNIYLAPEGGLSFDPPAQNDGIRYDEYVSDPNNPVPYTPVLTTDMDPPYMMRDQRFVRRRPDVLQYESQVLPRDLTIAGPIAPHLTVSTSGTDSDWVVKLIDVSPVEQSSYAASSMSRVLAPADRSRAGFQLLVRGDVIRSKFRTSLEKPQPMTPGEVTAIDFVMDDVLHTFKKGHRILVQIQSTWFPLVDLNPQTFVDIYHANDADFHKATQRVYHSAAQPSYLAVGRLSNEE